MTYSSDLDWMLKDAPGAVKVLCGGITGYAILHEESATFDDQGRTKVAGIKRSIAFNPATFPALVKNASALVGGTLYAVGPVAVQKNGTHLAELVEP